MKKALITGATGQDGSYLVELLIDKDYEVHALVRRTSISERPRLDALPCHGQIIFHYGDLCDSSSLCKILALVQPDEIYNLGAQSHVRVSFDVPEYTTDVDAVGTLRLLEAIRTVGLNNVRYYQASSSEMFGKVQEIPQTECTPFYPRSPYGCSKVYAYWISRNYRESYGIHASNGILFNHESPRRGEGFVSRKITRAATRIKCGLQNCIYLGNLDAQRDWGYAKEYVEMMWLMLQQDKPDDYVVATNETHSVREFCDSAFGMLDLYWQDYVRYDSKYDRPAEVDLLIGDPAKAKAQLGWEPKVKFKELVEIMVHHDLHLAEEEKWVADNKK